MKSHLRKPLHFIESKRKKLRKLKSSISEEEDYNSDDNDDSSYNESSIKKEDDRMDLDNDSDDEKNKSDNESDLDSNSIIKNNKSKSKDKTKSKTFAKSKSKSKLKANTTAKKNLKDYSREDKENMNMTNIKKVKKESSDEEEQSSNDEDNDEEREVSFLPCREVEQNKIYTYIKEGFQTTGAYSSLYIAGMPGTGKTASLLTVIKKLQYESSIPQVNKSKKASSQSTIPSFNYLYINGMKITNPSAVFKLIYNHIFSRQRSQKIKNYIYCLDNFFKNREDFDYKPILNDIKNSHLILIIDEIDCLISPKQELLYNIFNWTTYSKSKLIVISISNTFNLPSKLIPKVQSRMGTNKLPFTPYVQNDLYKIIQVKISDDHNFSEDALKFSCAKVATINGDLRRMLLICKRANELFIRETRNEKVSISKSRKKNDKKPQIQIRHIIQACQELFESKLVNVIKSLQFIDKIIIATILYSMKVSDDIKIKVSDLYSRKYALLSKNPNQITINWEEFTSIIFNLNSLKIISFADGFKDNFVNNYVCIKFYIDEFLRAVREDDSFKEVMDQFIFLMDYKEN